MLEGITSNKPDKSKTVATPKVRSELHSLPASWVNCPILSANGLIFSNSDRIHALSVCRTFNLVIVDTKDGFTGICPRSTSPECGRLKVKIGKPG